MVPPLRAQTAYHETSVDPSSAEHAYLAISQSQMFARELEADYSPQ